MVPKPFPHPLSIGIDVCDVRRVASLLRNQNLCNRWTRKVFTRLEWPAIWDQFQKAQRAITGDAGNLGWEDLVGSPDNHHNLWMLPEIPESWLNSTRTVRDENAHNKDVSSERSPVGILIRHLAGRWAAKEAVIKAHSNRRLYMQNISIMGPHLYPSIFPNALEKKSKPFALIDPQVDTILMDQRVAEIRALRGLGPQSRGFQKGAMFFRQEFDIKAPSNTAEEAQFDSATIDNGSEKYYQRRAKIKGSKRQIAEVSISHDGNTAVAVCLALNEPASEGKSKSVIDNGHSVPIHEPQWGDYGWLSKDYDLGSLSQRCEPVSEEE